VAVAVARPDTVGGASCIYAAYSPRCYVIQKVSDRRGFWRTVPMSRARTRSVPHGRHRNRDAEPGTRAVTWLRWCARVLYSDWLARDRESERVRTSEVPQSERKRRRRILARVFLHIYLYKLARLNENLYSPFSANSIERVVGRSVGRSAAPRGIFIVYTCGARRAIYR